MSLAVVKTRARLGIHAPLVTVEVHLSNGLPALNMVGLPETAVKESKDRVRSAILNSHFEFPARRITINLAPADLPKEGSRFDLAIAMGILAASEQIPREALDEYEFLGELALTGEVRPVQGTLPAALSGLDEARLADKDPVTLMVPSANGNEANLPSDAKVMAVKHLLDATAHFHGQQRLGLHESSQAQTFSSAVIDLADVKGQAQAKRALEVAAAGRHNLLFFGPPGTGKTLLASRLNTILPPMTEAEMLEVAAVKSIAGQGQFNYEQRYQRPFRAPHHTASAASLVGGGSYPKPGEITLAHHGVLFLDELPEFSRPVLEVLREPLENGQVMISRANGQTCFPAQFQLIAAMNPSPTGYGSHSSQGLGFSQAAMEKYLAKLSGPFLDRIDLHVEVPDVPREILSATTQGEDSSTVRNRVTKAFNRQIERQGKANHGMNQQELAQHCVLRNEDERFLDQALTKLKLSARSYHRLLKVARTLADLADLPSIERPQLAEALSYRQLDRLRNGR